MSGVIRPCAGIARVAAVLLAVSAGCGSDRTDPGPGDAGMGLPPPASARPPVALEGHRHYVVELFEPSGGADFTDATVSVEDPTGPLSLTSFRCNAWRCGALLSVADTRPNMARPIPAPIDGERYFLRITGPAGAWRALIDVRPLDVISNAGGAPLSVKDVQLASRIDVTDGAVFQGAPTGGPVRWIVFGGGVLRGTIDVSAIDGARVGGSAGGSAGATGEGPSGGGPGGSGAGAGGGGNALDGEAGQGADGSVGGGGAGGTGGGDIYGRCVDDFLAELCGGSGGGGSSGGGGAGGGALLLVSLDDLETAGARLVARGEAGTSPGGGGGAGGSIVFSAPAGTALPTIDVSGGEGGAGAPNGAGGAGAPGTARLEVSGTPTGDHLAGPAVDLRGLDQLPTEPDLLLTGTAEPGATITVGFLERPDTFTTTVEPTGVWSLSIILTPGLNRLQVRAESSGRSVRSWSGTHVEFEMLPGRPVPVVRGGLIDVVFVPASE